MAQITSYTHSTGLNYITVYFLFCGSIVNRNAFGDYNFILNNISICIKVIYRVDGLLTRA